MSAVNIPHHATCTGLLVAALAVVPSGNLLAQQNSPVVTGDRVRVSAPSVSEDPLVGTVLVMDSDSCVIDVEGRYKPVAVPLTSLESVEVYRGQRSFAAQGAAGGAIGGGIIGVGLAIKVCHDWDACRWDNENKTLLVTVVAGVGGAVLGAGLGALVGAFSKTDSWEELPLDEIRVGPAPIVGDGFAVSVSLRL